MLFGSFHGPLFPDVALQHFRSPWLALRLFAHTQGGRVFSLSLSVYEQGNVCQIALA